MVKLDNLIIAIFFAKEILISNRHDLYLYLETKLNTMKIELYLLKTGRKYEFIKTIELSFIPNIDYFFHDLKAGLSYIVKQVHLTDDLIKVCVVECNINFTELDNGLNL